MDQLAAGSLALMRMLLLLGCGLAVLIPAWWAAGRIERSASTPFFRLLVGVGLALVGYLTAINLIGRVVGHSTAPASAYILLNAITALALWRYRPADVGVRALLSSWKSWIGIVLLAVLCGIPQWLLAVSTPFWDEVASSAIHITAANQFAEGVYPPRHNALPDIAIKYHYAFTLLSGSLTWLTGLSANASIDIVSTSLWIFTFLFVYHWLRSLRLGFVAALWGSISSLLGGGLAWLYLQRIEIYSDFNRSPPASALTHGYDSDKGWFANLLGSADAPAAYLRNADGSLSNLPWDIAAQFQQHAVALGLVLTLIALYVFVLWLRSPGRSTALYLVNIAAFGVLFLGHAVFGGVAAVSAGLVLLLRFFRQPSRERLLRGVAFTVGVGVVAFLHGGLLSTGVEYGASSDVFRWRDGLGYAEGGVAGFIHWNLAGFGVPLLLALVACSIAFWRRVRGRPLMTELDAEASDAAGTVLLVLCVLTAFSYLVPQLAYYSSESSRVEISTEIVKFLFPAHLGLALLSAFGIAFLGQWGRLALAPGLLAMLVCPIAFSLQHSRTQTASGRGDDWIGFYRSPYYRNSVEEQMGATLRKLKRGPSEVYFDASADERNHNYLGELLIFGGSVFTLTPSRYERTGIGYRLSEDVVSRRFVQNGRMRRLRPAATEECGCRWYYSRPEMDFVLSPTLVRSRFTKLTQEGYLAERTRIGARVLYEVVRPTADLDVGIQRYWQPQVVMQTHSDWSGDGKDDLLFYDPAHRRILIDLESPQADHWRTGARMVASREEVIEPDQVGGELSQLYVGAFPGDPRVDFLFGRLKDTEYRHGERVEEVIERSSWGWSYRDSHSGNWQAEYERWSWDLDVPFIADLDHDGVDTQIAYHPSSGSWSTASRQQLSGPRAEAKQSSIPFGGRFLEGSGGDLGLWNPTTGTVIVQSVTDGRRVEFHWGGRAGQILLPADYDGDGYDEIGLWDRSNQTWYWRNIAEATSTEAKFGTSTSIPVPEDFNHDGIVDLAYWEPTEGVIYVSYSQGRTVDFVLTMPADSIPAFVNMH